MDLLGIHKDVLVVGNYLQYLATVVPRNMQSDQIMLPIKIGVD